MSNIALSGDVSRVFFFSSRRRHTRLQGDWIFFFQAEDGIRDYKVTGVQTCALPIWRPPAISRARYKPLFHGRQITSPKRSSSECERNLPIVFGDSGCSAACPAAVWDLFLRPANRSEERRVGKECRSRWSPYH